VLVKVNGLTYFFQYVTDLFSLIKLTNVIIQTDIDVRVLHDIKLALEGSVWLKSDFFFVASVKQKLSQCFILFLELLPALLVQEDADILGFFV